MVTSIAGLVTNELIISIWLVSLGNGVESTWAGLFSDSNNETGGSISEYNELPANGDGPWIKSLVTNMDSEKFFVFKRDWPKLRL